jgi:hypothetical protein
VEKNKKFTFLKRVTLHFWRGMNALCFHRYENGGNRIHGSKFVYHKSHNIQSHFRCDIHLVWAIMCYHMIRFFNHKQGQISDLAHIVNFLNIFSQPLPPQISNIKMVTVPCLFFRIHCKSKLYVLCMENLTTSVTTASHR